MKRVLSWASTALTVLSLLCVLAAGVEVTRRLSLGRLSVAPGFLCAALTFQAAGYLLLAWGFARFIAQHASRAPRFAETSELYYRSLLARYLPGKVGLPTVRVLGAAQLGVPRAVLLASVALEGLAWVGTGALLALGTAALAGPDIARMEPLPAPMTWLLLFVVPLGLVTLTVVERARYPAIVLRFVPTTPARGPLLPGSLVLANALTWIVQSASAALVALAVGGSEHTARLAGFAALASSLLGFVALPVPAGMGVREAAMVFLLGPGLGADRALLVALIVRASSLVLECGAWLVARALAPPRTR